MPKKLPSDARVKLEFGIRVEQRHILSHRTVDRERHRMADELQAEFERTPCTIVEKAKSISSEAGPFDLVVLLTTAASIATIANLLYNLSRKWGSDDVSKRRTTIITVRAGELIVRIEQDRQFSVQDTEHLLRDIAVGDLLIAAHLKKSKLQLRRKA